MFLNLTIVSITDNDDECIGFNEEILTDIWNKFTDINNKIPEEIEYTIDNKKYIITFNYMVNGTGILGIKGNYILGLKDIEENKNYLVIISSEEEEEK